MLHHLLHNIHHILYLLFAVKPVTKISIWDPAPVFDPVTTATIGPFVASTATSPLPVFAYTWSAVGAVALKAYTPHLTSASDIGVTVILNCVAVLLLIAGCVGYPPTIAALVTLSGEVAICNWSLVLSLTFTVYAGKPDDDGLVNPVILTAQSVLAVTSSPPVVRATL